MLPVPIPKVANIRRGAPSRLVWIAVWSALLLTAFIVPNTGPLQLPPSGVKSRPASAVPSAEPVSGQGRPLQVMTYNIRHAKGMNGRVNPLAVLRELKAAAADVIALQEVDRLRWRSGLQDQARYFAQSMGMHYIYAPAIRRGMSQYGVALLSRYPLEASQIHRLAGGREPRLLLTAELRLPDRTVTVATTHLSVEAEGRTREWPQLLAALRDGEAPLILLGDFNCPSSNPELQATIRRLGLKEVRPKPSLPTVAHGGRIDHIFTNLPAEKPALVRDSRASDHRPVFARLNETEIPLRSR
ncbi:endonuclease/exonuclease/phosphatase family protein [Paenibacillus ehimensis]|uniref:Endonuclease/exonuclease/phosphatase family protein n=1 Tax=Paenibacillus ehimensis TaxID=79264 RepID=A0ABT8VM23_9BACL|nr:endonuclease/exonuclease/phosphatase family protein [Paenibacillus ehimensis]MDO3682032.1 endonuclease/exonuclease/phosphatase family protein [Paenibacillus ehimensis]MEC0213917.1 endonuclease/exonuclease/phosphatase family protein [Paenibacillus ehimensis]